MLILQHKVKTNMSETAAKTFTSEEYDSLNPPLITGEELANLRRQMQEEAEAREQNNLDRFSKVYDVLSTTDFPENENTRSILDDFPPVESLSVADREFYFSQVFQSGNRKHAIGYTVLEDGLLAPRLFYKSKSDGFWRVSPIIDAEEQEDGTKKMYYSKGETMADGYVRETRLHDDISECLEGLESSIVSVSREKLHELKGKFVPERLGRTHTYQEEAFGIKIRDLSEFFQFQPGTDFITPDGRLPRDVISEMKVPDTLKADFSQKPIKAVNRQHEMLGDVVVESYPSNDGRVIWNMARTSNGIVWINGLTKAGAGAEVSSYGTDHEVILCGVLDNKPIEYVGQLNGLEEGVDYIKIPNTSYAQLTVLEKLEPVKEYRDAKKLAA